MRNLLCILFALSFSMNAYSQTANYDNTVIVLDASGSMNDPMRSVRITKMDAAKKAIAEVVSKIPETTNIGVVVFSNQLRQQPWIYPLAPKNNGRIVNAVNSVSPGGSTPLAEYMKAGADTLLVARTRNHEYGTYRLLVVTDGEADNTELMNQYAKDILTRGIKLDVIGVDMKGDHTLSKTAHTYRRADDLESLKKAISEVFAEIPSASSSGSTDFSLLEGLPDALAMEIITTITEKQDHFIGEKKPPKKVSQILSPTPVPSQNTTTAGATNVAPASGVSLFGLIPVVIFGIIAFAVIIIFIVVEKS